MFIILFISLPVFTTILFSLSHSFSLSLSLFSISLPSLSTFTYFPLIFYFLRLYQHNPCLSWEKSHFHGRIADVYFRPWLSWTSTRGYRYTTGEYNFDQQFVDVRESIISILFAYTITLSFTHKVPSLTCFGPTSASWLSWLENSFQMCAFYTSLFPSLTDWLIYQRYPQDVA